MIIGGDNWPGNKMNEQPRRINYDKSSKIQWLLCMATVFVFMTSFDSARAEVDRNRQRLEELFLWRASDTLGLDTKEEMEFSHIIKDMRDEKAAFQKKLEELLKRLEVSAKDTDRTLLLDQYKGVLKDYNTIPIREVEKIEKLLGAKRTAQYLVLKEQLFSKLKDMLSDPLRETSTNVKATDKATDKSKSPKVIHED